MNNRVLIAKASKDYCIPDGDLPPLPLDMPFPTALDFSGIAQPHTKRSQEMILTPFAWTSKGGAHSAWGLKFIKGT